MLSSLKIRDLRLQTQKVELADQSTIIQELEKKFEEAEQASAAEGLEKIKTTMLKDYSQQGEATATELAEALQEVYDFLASGGYLSVQDGIGLTEDVRDTLTESFKKIAELVEEPAA